jgi:surface antigen Omp85-like protein
MLRRLIAPVALSVLLAAASGIAAVAQDTRTAVLEQKRAEKAAQVQPYQPGRLEKALLYVEQQDPFGRLAPHNGFFVRYSYHSKPIGSGLAMSGGFRHDVLDRRARVVLEAGASVRKYSMVRVDFSVPALAGGLAELGVEARYRHQPQEDFYGLGSVSLVDDRVSFKFDGRQIESRAVAKPFRGVSLGTRIGRIDVSVGSGTDRRFPSIEERFTDSDAPGLGQQPVFLYGDLFGAIDRRDQPGNARAGGYYGLAWRRYSDRELDRYSFRLIDADLQHFFPIFDKKRVFAVRGRLMSTKADAGNEVPFYFRPTLGGSESLRSAQDFRFRDNHSLFMNFEYRWEAFSGLDMALFTDLGKVTARVRDVNLRNLRRAYGIGMRFNTYRSVFLRIDVATGGGDGFHYFFKFSKAF